MGEAKSYTIFHIRPGLVGYTTDTGQEHTVLVTKKVLDAMNSTFLNKPVFNGHKMINSEEAFDLKNGPIENKADGIVNDVGYDEDTGRFYVTAQIWDDETQLLALSPTMGASCSYEVDKVGPAGIYNNISYDEEVLGGTHLHLAIVDTPRYSDTQIVQNSTQDGGLIVNFKFKKQEPKKPKVKTNEALVKEEVVAEESSSDIDPNASVEVDGEMVRLSTLAEAYLSAKKENEVIDSVVSPEEILLIEGEEVSVQELIDVFQASKVSEEAGGEILNNELPNTVAPPEPSKVPKKEAPNVHFKKLQNAANKSAEGPPLDINSADEGRALGRSTYIIPKKGSVNGI